MDLTLTTSDLEVSAAAGDEPDAPRRTITGQAAPWNITRRVSSGQLVRFLPGSIDLAAMPVVRDHDSTRPVGLVASAHDDDDGHQVAVRIAGTRDGDETLILAGDGIIRGFSVGVSATEWTTEEQDGESVLIVSASAPRELSLLINPAYGHDSAVASVAAATHNTEEETMEQPTTAPTPAVAAATPEGPTDLTTPTVAVVTHEPAPVLTAGQFIVETVLAQRGDPEAALVIQAVLAAETTLTNPGVIPDQYVGSIIGGLNVYRPVWASVGHGQLPAAGNNLIRPNWTTLPKVQKYATENTEPPTGAVQIGNITIPKESWAHAITASIALVNRSDPGYAEAYFREAVQSYYGALEADIAAQLVAATTSAGSVDIAALAVSTAVQQSVAAQAAANPDGEFAGQWPTWALVGMDLWGGLVGAATAAGLAFGSGSMQMDAADGSLSGIIVRACPHIPPADCIAGDPAAAELYEQTVMDLRALVVNTMSWEMGVYTDTAFQIVRPLVLGRATYDPLAAPLAATARKAK